MNFRRKTFVKFLILFLFVSQAAFGQIRVAITNFENQTDEILLDAWQRNLPDFLGAELGSSKDITLLERNRLKELFNEFHLALSGFVQDTALVEKIGKLAGADVIISGIITKVDRRYVVLARITRVKTTEVMVEKVEAHDRKHFQEMVKLLANNIRYRLTGEGEYLYRASLQQYPTGYFLLGALVSGVIGGVLQQNSKKAYDDYHAAQSLNDFDRYYRKANNLQKLSGAFFALAGAGLLGATVAWIKNMKQEDLKAGSDNRISFNYWWNSELRGAGFGFCLRF